MLGTQLQPERAGECVKAEKCAGNGFALALFGSSCTRQARPSPGAGRERAARARWGMPGGRGQLGTWRCKVWGCTVLELLYLPCCVHQAGSKDVSGRDRLAGCPHIDVPASLVCTPAGFKALSTVGCGVKGRSCGAASVLLTHRAALVPRQVCAITNTSPLLEVPQTRLWSKPSSGLIPSSGLTAAWTLTSTKLLMEPSSSRRSRAARCPVGLLRCPGTAGRARRGGIPAVLQGCFAGCELRVGLPVPSFSRSQPILPYV